MPRPLSSHDVDLPACGHVPMSTCPHVGEAPRPECCRLNFRLIAMRIETTGHVQNTVFRRASALVIVSGQPRTHGRHNALSVPGLGAVRYRQSYTLATRNVFTLSCPHALMPSRHYVSTPARMTNGWIVAGSLRIIPWVRSAKPRIWGGRQVIWTTAAAISGASVARNLHCRA